MDSLVLSNMFHRPARTVVSVFGIAIGVLLIVFTVGLSNGTMRERAKREGNVGAEIMVRASGSLGMSGTEAFRLPISLGGEIAKVDGVRTVVPVGQNTVSSDDNNTGSRVVDGVNFDEYSAITGIQIIEGRPVADKGDEAIIDTGWQRQKNFRVGDKLKIYERDFTIVGTYEPAAGARLKIPLGTMQEQLGGEGKTTTFLVKIDEAFDLAIVAEKIDNAFPETQVIPTSELEDLYMQGIPQLNVFLNVFIGVAAVISALVVLLTMYTTVTERTRQIGIMKSLGMGKARIAWTITQESLLISLLGIISGIFLTVLLRFALTRISTLEVEISPRVLLITMIAGLIGGAIGALYPALRAARLDAVEALSYD
ncbi:MAG: ABC transporter permease [Acidobacteria bacterium]|nr:ABC transporter permease [Acidobacteriota bacterium]MCA1608264.1 ABC transporter permease [Acidobacteriota bacterium]